MHLKFYCNVSLLILVSTYCFGQEAGSPDFHFGDQGISYLPTGDDNAQSRDVVVLDNSKILIAGFALFNGSSDFTLLRLDQHGDPDPTFGDNGIVHTDFNNQLDIAEGIAIDHLQRIVVAGYVQDDQGLSFGVCRYLPDGQLDSTFGDAGKVIIKAGPTSTCKDVAIQEDHKIVLGGYAFNLATLSNEFVVVRLTEGGSLDSTFNGTGMHALPVSDGSSVANALTLMPNGRILLAGQAFNPAAFAWEAAVVRFNSDGTLDHSWDEEGTALISFAEKNYTINAITVTPELDVIIGGYLGTAPSNNLFVVAKFDGHGKPDNTFGDHGQVIDSYGAQDNQIYSLLLQPDGQLLIGGFTLSGSRDVLAIARLTPEGDFDPTFDDDGVVIAVPGENDGIEAMTLQKDGKLVVVGESFNGTRFEIIAGRFETGLTTHTSDPEFEAPGLLLYPNPAIANNDVHLSITGATAPTIILTDHQGRELHQYKNVIVGSNETITLTIPAALTAGTYWISVIDNGRVKTQPLITTAD